MGSSRSDSVAKPIGKVIQMAPVLITNIRAPDVAGLEPPWQTPLWRIPRGTLNSKLDIVKHFNFTLALRAAALM